MKGLQMDKNEFRKVMLFMYKAFRQEPNEDEFEAYYTLLKVYDIAMVKQSVHSLCTTFKYFPRVADIVEAMVKVPEEREIAEEVLKIAEDSSYKEYKDIEFRHELTEAIIVDLGLGRIGKMSPQDLRDKVHFSYKEIMPSWKDCKMKNRVYQISYNRRSKVSSLQSTKPQSLKSLLNEI